jgi:hypothetical protein
LSDRRGGDVAAKWLATRDVPLNDLERFPGNARRGNVPEIAESLYRNGQYRALVVRVHENAMTILAGNHTRDAMELLYGGWLPKRAAPSSSWQGRPAAARCELIECDDDTARRINLADNKTAEDGTYDNDALSAILDGLDGDYEGTGWTAEEHAALLALGDGDGEGGDAPEDNLPATFGVIVECDTEQQQARLLAQLDGEGFRVRALMS